MSILKGGDDIPSLCKYKFVIEANRYKECMFLCCTALLEPGEMATTVAMATNKTFDAPKTG